MPKQIIHCMGQRRKAIEGSSKLTDVFHLKSQSGTDDCFSLFFLRGNPWTRDQWFEQSGSHVLTVWLCHKQHRDDDLACLTASQCQRKSATALLGKKWLFLTPRWQMCHVVEIWELADGETKL